jgi:glycosyltransferase involved in cell wall biosynthesis
MTAQLDCARLEVALLATRLSVLGHDPCGGSEILLWEDYEILRQAAIPVRVYGRAAHNGAPVTQIPLHTGLPLLSSAEYCGRFLRREPEAVLMAYNEPMLAGLAPGRSIVRFDWSTPLPRYWKLPVWLSRFQSALYLFPSESERGLFLEDHPRIPPGAAVVLPNAVDLKLFCPGESATIPLRVGYAGQWAPCKGMGVLLDAWGPVKNRIPAAELWLAGSAELWKSGTVTPGAPELAARVEAMAGQGLLRVAGERKRAEMPGFWNSVHVAVVPSLYESFGLAALEALACGVPVVASAAGGLKEIVVHGECGLLVPPNDPGQLAEALLSVLTNQELRGRLAAGARHRAQQFSLAVRAERLLRLLASRARRPLAATAAGTS